MSLGIEEVYGNAGRLRVNSYEIVIVRWGGRGGERERLGEAAGKREIGERGAEGKRRE